MEASSSQINRHFYCRNLFSDDGSRPKFKPLIGSLSYACRATALPRLSITMRIEGSREESPGSEIKTTLSNTADKPTQHMQGVGNSYPIAEQVGGNLGTDASVPVEGSVQQKKTAKIHDFCLGLPFGGLVLSGGLVGFLFSKNLTTLTTGVLYGGALLALSMYSLKVWRQGKSSLPFILGQSALAAALLAKHFQTYSLTKKLFPTGFYAVVSAAMLCFYTYVMLSGGNPPPKKLKLATSTLS
ncbi:protein FATTY ACID EXPORT 1, chloroplastic-like [Magnolia sinica]|uniref:protein FATTY ACID EXPORT 1, chloroplastic-like n=1 Tax=Magnolia sinica TaxID=86752 RepID=UPI00265A867C|nr:protein FATTY ACID EXPORT 1, chloroplastic-like [Magnolia sinica]